MATRIIIYDDYCPLCSWYTGLFVKTGFLEQDGRREFSSLDPSLLAMIDSEKGKAQIPLIDLDKKKVFYGVDALLEILATKFPLIKTVGNLKFVNWGIRRIYKLISFNRKVIVGKKCGTGKFDCSPEFSFRYRLIFMLLFLMFNTLMLGPIHDQILTKLSFYHLEYSVLQLGHLVFVAVNCLLAFSFQRQKAIEYLGQINMLAFLAIILLSPLLMINMMLEAGDFFTTIYLISLTIFILHEYIRRMEFLNIISEHRVIASINLACIFGFIVFVFK